MRLNAIVSTHFDVSRSNTLLMLLFDDDDDDGVVVVVVVHVHTCTCACAYSCALLLNQKGLYMPQEERNALVVDQFRGHVFLLFPLTAFAFPLFTAFGITTNAQLPSLYVCRVCTCAHKCTYMCVCEFNCFVFSCESLVCVFFRKTFMWQFIVFNVLEDTLFYWVRHMCC